MTHVDSSACQDIVGVFKHFGELGQAVYFVGIRGNYNKTLLTLVAVYYNEEFKSKIITLLEQCFKHCTLFKAGSVASLDYFKRFSSQIYLRIKPNLALLVTLKNITLFLKKNGPTRPLFRLFSVFFKQTSVQFYNKLM